MKKSQVSFPSEKGDVYSHSTHSATMDFGHVDAEDDEDFQFERLTSRGPLFDEPNGETELADNRRLSWFTASTGDVYAPLHKIIQEDPDTVEKFKLLLKPPEFDQDDILCAVHSFMKSLADYIPSIKQDKTFDTIKAVRKLVSQPDSVRLYGLVTHFCYWNIVYPVVKKVMQDLRSKEPKYHLFEGVDLDHEPADRNKLPKALREPLTSGKKLAPITTVNMSAQDEQIRAIDRMFHRETQNPHLQRDHLDIHVESNIQQATDHHSDAGCSSSLYSHDASHVSNVSLTFQEKENLYVQLETCILTIFRKMGKSKYSLVIGRQALVSCCHIVTDEILTTVYPWFAFLPSEYDDELEDKNEFGDKRNLTVARQVRLVNQRLRRLLHQSISDLIDPSRAYTSTLLILNFVGSSQYTSKLLAAGKQSRLLASSRSLTKANRGGTNNLGGKGKYFRTSAAVIALFSDTTSYKARTFLQRGSALYAPVPGSVQPFTTRIRKQQEQEQRLKEEEIARKTITWEKLLALAEDNNVTTTHPDAIPPRASSFAGLVHAHSSPSLQPLNAHSPPASPPSGIRAISPFSPPKDRSLHSSSAGHRGLHDAPTSRAHSSSGQRVDSHGVSGSPSRIGSSSAHTRPSTGHSSTIHVRDDHQIPMPWQPRPLDFSRLFEEQPEAYYRPVKLFDPKLAPGCLNKRGTTVGDHESEDTDHQSQMSHNSDHSSSHHHSRGVSSHPDAPHKLAVSTAFPFSPDSKRGVSTFTTSRGGDDRAKAFDEHSLSSTSYISGTFGGTTVGDAPSIAHNSLAPMPISLRAKSALMTLMVDKSARTYRSEIQTRQTRLRTSLLKGAGPIGG